MRVTEADCTVLYSPEASGTSINTAVDNAIVRVYTDEGMTGIGEAEANPWVIKALIESSGTHSLDRSLAQLLIGHDPLRPQAVWESLYQNTILTGRRGVGIAALGAIDMALWDICGQKTGHPIWKLLGNPNGGSVVPYASLLPVGRTLAEFRESLLSKAEWAREAGFRALKAEVLVKGPWAVGGLSESDDTIVELVAETRKTIGDEMELMVDVGYCWQDWQEALACIRRLERYKIYFVETPLPTDDLAGYGRLAQASGIPIAAGELLSTRFEFEHLLDIGRVSVAQPDVGRVGGITEALRVMRMAEERGIRAVPHCWKSGIGVAATAHVAAVSPNCPFIEYLPPEVSDSQLRRCLLKGELVPYEGQIELPQEPGLGVRLNPESLAEFAVGLAPQPVLCS